MSDMQPHQRYIPPSRRRDKPVLSCSLCRRRKLRCDRQQPCGACVHRGLSLSCTYSHNASTPPTSSTPNPASNVHDRISQLEKLVTTLMDSKNSGEHKRVSNLSTAASPPRADPNHAPDTEAPGTPVHITLDSDETKYTDSGHWISILDSIAELKDELDQIPSGPPPEHPADDNVGPDLLFGLRRQATRQDLIAGLPTKAGADELLEKYWGFVDMAPSVMHKPKFQREYNEFWQNPNEKPVMWIGMLYGMFAIAARVQSLVEEHDAGIHNPSQRTFSQARQDAYREKVAQCLVLGNYAKCPPYTMETFLFYFVVEYLRSRDTQHGVWLLVGMIVRTAFRMGLHREPTKLTSNNLSPFECEMRRRMWSMIVRLDLMSSGQVGLPRMIHPAMSDTLEPRNLKDEDLEEDMTELPPSRSDTEFTPMLYTIVRNRVLAVFARVVDLVSASEQPTYREVLEIDEILRTTYEKRVPATLKAESFKDFDPSRKGSMYSLILGLTFLKALEMLHRPFLFLARTDSRYEYSRTACVDAALEILDIQHTMEVQSQDSKRLWDEQSLWWTSSWRLSSLITHDFLLATTVLALDLDRDLVKPVPVRDTPRERFKSGQPARAEIIHALTRVYETWSKSSSRSREAQRVAAAVKHVLGKAGASGFIHKPTSETTPSQANFSFYPQQELPDPSFFFDPNNARDQLSSFTTDEVQMNFGEYGDSFDWAGLETSYPMGPLGENMRTYFA